jgi:hypothetical protein
MSKSTTLYMIVTAIVLALLVTTLPVFAQLIMSNQKMKIIKVERNNHIIQGRVHAENKDNIQYIQIDGNTRFSTNNRSISQNEAWNLLQKGMTIRVKGGVTMGGQIKAKSIYW